MGTLAGKTVLITGATAGIGFETARVLALDGASVFITGRTQEKTRAAVEALKRLTNGAVDGFTAELSSMAEVRRLSNEVERRCPSLHVLVNNAGAVHYTREVTVDGFERTFATNHLAYFLLTVRLLPVLQRSGPARIVNVSSRAHRRVTMDFDDLMAARSYWPREVYGRSKLANVLFTRELARRLEGTGVTTTCLHPGVVASNFFVKPGLLGVLGRIARRFMISVEEGAKTSVFLARDPSVAQVSGKYFNRCVEETPSRAALDEQAARRLWEVSEQLTKRWA